jgi:hypothetical protein
VRNGTTGRSLDIPDSAAGAATPLPDGWAWIPGTIDRVVVDRGGTKREILKPAWMAGIVSLDISPDGRRLAIQGWNLSTGDTLGLFVAPVDGGDLVRWAASFAERGYPQWLNNSTLLFTVWVGQESVALSRVTGPGQVEQLGVIPHPADGVSLSNDFKRGTLAWNDYHGDAWLYRVVKP